MHYYSAKVGRCPDEELKNLEHASEKKRADYAKN